VKPTLLLVLATACGSPLGTASVPAAVQEPSAAVFGAAGWRVPGTVDYIGFFDDERSIVVGTQHGSVVGFGIDGERRSMMEGLLDDVHGFAAVDAHSLVLAGETPMVVDLATHGKRPLGLARRVTTIAVAGARAVVGEPDGPLSVVNLADGQPLAALEHSRGYTHPVISGDWVIAGRRERAVGIWDLATGKRHRVFALGNSPVFALSPDRRLIATGTFAGKPNWAVDVYRVEDGVRTATVGFACNPGAIAISPNSELLAIACDDEIRIVKLPNGEPVASLGGPGSYVRTAAWSPSGKLLAVGGNDNVLHVWRGPAWEPLTRVVGSRGEIRELDVADRFLVAHSWGDRSAWLWVTDAVKPVIELGGPKREIMAASLDGEQTLLAVTHVGKERTASIERWRKGTHVASVALPTSSYGLSTLVRELGPVDGGGAWFTSEGRVTTLDAALRVTWRSPETDEDGVTSGDGEAAGTPDGRRVLVDTRRRLIVIDAIAHLVVADVVNQDCGAARPAVSPDGRWGALVDPHGVTIVSMETARPFASLAFPSDEIADRAVAWSSADQIVALAAGKLVMWKVAAPAAAVVPAPSAVSVAVLRDQIYLGRTDGTVERRSLAALHTLATKLEARHAERCEPSRGGYGMMGGGFLLGGDVPRGRLDDKGAYDEPDPDFSAESLPEP
jgi:hypothetical protein